MKIQITAVIKEIREINLKRDLKRYGLKKGATEADFIEAIENEIKDDPITWLSDFIEAMENELDDLEEIKK